MNGTRHRIDLALLAALLAALLVTVVAGGTAGCKPTKKTFRVPGAHLLISEVKDRSPEFIEIHNPTGAPLALDGYRISDQADYYRIAFGGSSAGLNSFNANFPGGATIGAYGYQVIAPDGGDFLTRTGRLAEYAFTNHGGSAPMGGQIGGSGSLLANDGESLILYYWDGTSTYVRDVDMVAFGDGNGNWPVNKSGVIVGTYTYLVDNPYTYLAPRLAGKSLARIDLSEALEYRADGNGLGGHDETSEDFDESFMLIDTPTPGGP